MTSSLPEQPKSGDGPAGEMFALLGEAWPVVAARLRRSLRRRGLDEATSEDIAQEVAARAIRARVRFDSPADLYPWASTVGHRLATDLADRVQAASFGEFVEDRPSTTDVAREVEQRVVLEAVVEQLRSMPAVDRAAIAFTLGGRAPADRAERLRWADRRRRVREKLRAQFDGVRAGAGVLAVLRYRRAMADHLGWTVATAGLVALPVVAGIVAAGHHPQPPAATRVATTGPATSLSPAAEAFSAHHRQVQSAAIVRVDVPDARSVRSSVPHEPAATATSVTVPAPGPAAAPLAQADVAGFDGDDLSVCFDNIRPIGSACITAPTPPNPIG